MRPGNQKAVDLPPRAAGVLPDSVLLCYAFSCNIATDAWRNLLIKLMLPLGTRPSNQVVGGSNPSGRANSPLVHSGHMVNTLFRRHGLHLLRGEGIGAGFNAALILVEEA